ncbi:bifunctional 4-hydroxy-2-oxoglutarate aldolase/2-dehydro-3-deoxy-phosphogluconate aldolase [Fictibacillus phosphorivorans]|uniref:bifunctional 4-hydroxy-2-oxoglutarate aldolase/2-dehydro-3-deoxy-phosphogluconate aldolase n=1 Tax=Fictibacillus phosphorivorans TaxID=1221500 RepID=UPI00203D6C45|nr:bifunctional 4-hydroxy-2-oxoglutarate aldolase/2-dehydro-3-deoxy-phosphogluconate aldolase [Fictibacillus phosphorivorans]MCM3719012.1 bifunctional 4-hydroxy-2-oxoglutarate aldolase/2-dehydro-3-deoxy-phosphogluconate aldolase [Fictibacillus phosphorivorans]MCM3776634.1 bifunctional 4-hydroxy-2-oxoglutarate aldolase/2-dehydro-3-deoxy-phosphogluconate aldolase [Fictibacillus phosphorivorans]
MATLAFKELEHQQQQDLLKQTKLIAVLRASSVNEAIEKGEALVESGISCLELTFTIPEAEKVIRHFSTYENLIVGAGTVMNIQQAQLAVAAGAQFLISPGYVDELVHYAQERNVLYIPGVLTPSEVTKAYNQGLTLLKLFPASQFGPSYLKGLRDPFPDINFIPTGGISDQNAKDWLDAGAVAIGLGGGMTKGTLSEIRENVLKVKKAIQ